MANTFNRREMMRLAAAGAFAATGVSWLDIAARRGMAQPELLAAW